MGRVATALAAGFFLAHAACGSSEVAPSADAGRVDVEPVPDADLLPDVMAVDSDAPADRCPGSMAHLSHFVPLPPPGVPADLGQICSAAQSPIQSSGAGRISIGNYSPLTQTATGWVAVPDALHLATTAFPTVTVVSASQPALANVQIGKLGGIQGGYLFTLHWPDPLPQLGGAGFVLKLTMTVACEDGGTRTIEAISYLEKCDAPLLNTWESGGDYCTLCVLYQDMPIRDGGH